MSPVKEQLIRLIQDQPEDSSLEEIVRELAFAAMVERGLADSDAGSYGDADSGPDVDTDACAVIHSWTDSQPFPWSSPQQQVRQWKRPLGGRDRDS